MECKHASKPISSHLGCLCPRANELSLLGDLRFQRLILKILGGTKLETHTSSTSWHMLLARFALSIISISAGVGFPYIIFYQNRPLHTLQTCHAFAFSCIPFYRVWVFNQAGGLTKLFLFFRGAHCQGIHGRQRKSRIWVRPPPAIRPTPMTSLLPSWQRQRMPMFQWRRAVAGLQSGISRRWMVLLRESFKWTPSWGASP